MTCLINTAGKTAKTNEEFSKALKQRMRIFQWMIPFGIVALFFGVGNEALHFFIDNSLLNGFYTGIGCGMIAASIVQIIRYRRILKEESLIRKERLKIQDERNQTIARKAQQAALFTVLIFSYFLMLAVGYFSRIAFFSVWGITVVLFLSYLFFYGYYNKKL